MRILMLTRYSRMGASSRLRTFQFLPKFEENGVKAVVCPLFGDAYLTRKYAGGRVPFREIVKAYVDRFKRLRASSDFDLVWVEKEALPFVPWIIEEFVGVRRVPYVEDYDDALFHRYDLHTNWLVRKALGTKIDRVMRNAACVVAGNSYLAQHAQQAGAQTVEVVRTVLDPARYTVPNADTTTFRIGWIGSPSTSKYLEIVKPALVRAKDELDAEIVLVGAAVGALKELKPTVRNWSECREAELISDFSVGIMPLPDTPWERGKCGYKLLQYMASSTPVTASPVGANTDIVADGKNGFLAQSQNDWFDAFFTLKHDPSIGREMGRCGRRLVEREFNIDTAGNRLLSIVSEFSS